MKFDTFSWLESIIFGDEDPHGRYKYINIDIPKALKEAEIDKPLAKFEFIVPSEERFSKCKEWIFG